MSIVALLVLIPAYLSSKNTFAIRTLGIQKTNAYEICPEKSSHYYCNKNGLHDIEVT